MRLILGAVAAPGYTGVDRGMEVVSIMILLKDIRIVATMGVNVIAQTGSINAIERIMKV